MMRRRLLFSALLLVGCSVTAPAAPDTAQPAPPLVSPFDRRTVAIMSAATRVETFQIDGDFEPSNSLLDRRDYARSKDDMKTYREIARYPVLAVGPVQGKPSAAKLAHGLLSLSGFYGSAGCFSPGIAFCAWRGKECVEMIVCFSCGHRLVITKDALGRIVHQADVPNSPELLPMALQAFPHDKILRVLTAQRSAPPPVPQPNVQPLEADNKLIEAVARGDSATFEARLNAISQEDLRTPTGPLALMMAVRAGQTEMVRRLLDRGVPAGGAGELMGSPLMWAAALGQSDIVLLLLAHGADVNTRAREEYTAIMAASRSGQTDMVQLLLSKGANLADKDENARSLLLLAAQRGQSETATFLLSQGMDINGRDKDGETALSLAAQDGRVQTVRQLLDKGAALDAADNHGATALMIAAERGRTEVASCLLQHGADIESRDRDATTPLMQAAMQAATGELDCARLFLDHGAEVNARDHDGDTALSLVVPYGNQAVPLVRLLIAHGASVQTRDKDGTTPLLRAVRCTPIMEMLLEKGAAVDAADADGDTPLLWAADHDDLPGVRLLLRHRADVHHRDRYGDDALTLARKDNAAKVLPALLQSVKASRKRS